MYVWRGCWIYQLEPLCKISLEEMRCSIKRCFLGVGYCPLLSKNRKFNTNNVCKLHLCIAVRYCGMFFASASTHSNKWWNRWNLRVPPAAVLAGGCWRLNLSDLDSFPSSLYSAGLCSSWEKVSPSIKISNIFDHQILFALEISHAALIWINSRP